MKNIHALHAVESLCHALDNVALFADSEIDRLKQELEWAESLHEIDKKCIAELEQKVAELVKQLAEVDK